MEEDEPVSETRMLPPTMRMPSSDVEYASGCVGIVAHLAALRRLADFSGQRVLEMGCGEGRIPHGIAAEAAHVLAFDPDADSVAAAERDLPAELSDRVEFRVASTDAIEIERGAFDLVVFSWSL